MSGEDDSARLSAGSEVADYVILATLGVGGSGTVYRAKKKDSDELVALKVMNAEHFDNDSERQRFEREAEVVKRLAHPHVVGLLDYGYADRLPYLVFPLLEGRTLEDRISKEGALGWGLTGRFSEQMLSALEVAHGMGIAHRDIKPANIFLARAPDGTETIQILDFGTAKIVGKKQQEMDVTRAGLMVGTPRYMAPEQVRMEELTPAADVYAFGLVMAEMMTGRPLVDGKSEFDIFVAQGSDKAHVLPDEIAASPFATVIERAVAKPFEVRYRLASQMLADIRAVLARFGAGNAGPGEADMEATQFIVAPEPVAPNENAMKLRKAFNAIADKNAAAAPAPKAPPAPPPPALPPPPAPPPPTMDVAPRPAASVAPWSAEPVPGAPAFAAPMQPMNAAAMQPMNAAPMQPMNAAPMQPMNAAPMQPMNAAPVQPMNAAPMQPMNAPVQQAPYASVESQSWSGQYRPSQPGAGGNLPPTTMRMSIPQQPPGAPQPWAAQDPRASYPSQPQGPYGQMAPPGVYGPPQQPFAPPPAMQVAPRKSSSQVWLFLVALVVFVAAGAALAVILRNRG